MPAQLTDDAVNVLMNASNGTLRKRMGVSIGQVQIEPRYGVSVGEPQFGQPEQAAPEESAPETTVPGLTIPVRGMKGRRPQLVSITSEMPAGPDPDAEGNRLVALAQNARAKQEDAPVAPDEVGNALVGAAGGAGLEGLVSVTRGAGPATKAALDFLAPEEVVTTGGTPASKEAISRAAANKRWVDALAQIRQELLAKQGTVGEQATAAFDEATNAGVRR